ncbi:MAG TPA: hypothetical protein VIV60_02890 [Polyangiaceae bacterium]
MKVSLEPLIREGHSITPKVEDRRLFVKLAGTFDMTAATALQIYLDQAQREARKEQVLELVIDISDVCYLGSSCLKSFVTLTVSLQRGAAGMLLRILINPRLDWQQRAFLVLARAAPNRVVVAPIA